MVYRMPRMISRRVVPHTQSVEELENDGAASTGKIGQERQEAHALTCLSQIALSLSSTLILPANSVSIQLPLRLSALLL
jgi:hypothetical protein